MSILSVGGEPSSKYSILFINSLFAQNTLFFPIPFLFFLLNLLWILIITYQLIYLLIFVSIYLRIGHPHRLLFVLFEISIYVFSSFVLLFLKILVFPFCVAVHCLLFFLFTCLSYILYFHTLDQVPWSLASYFLSQISQSIYFIHTLNLKFIFMTSYFTFSSPIFNMCISCLILTHLLCVLIFVRLWGPLFFIILIFY